MATAQHADGIDADTVDQVQFILARLFTDGQQWVRSIDMADWRRRYVEARARRSANGPSLTYLVKSSELVSAYVAKAASDETGRLHAYVIVKGDNGCLKDGAIAFVRPVLKLNFDGEPTLNFHVWFHSMPPGSVDDHVMVGWRFEGPEGGDEASPHDFFHAQPLRAFGPEEVGYGLHDRFPTRFPTIPLPASNVVELCLTAVLVACGKEALRKFVRSSARADVRAAANTFWTKVFGLAPPRAATTVPA